MDRNTLQQHSKIRVCQTLSVGHLVLKYLLTLGCVIEGVGGLVVTVLSAEELRPNTISVQYPNVMLCTWKSVSADS